MTDALGTEIVKDSRLAAKKCEILAAEGIVIASGEVIPQGSIVLLPYGEVVMYADKLALSTKALTPKYK